MSIDKSHLNLVKPAFPKSGRRFCSQSYQTGPKRGAFLPACYIVNKISDTRSVRSDKRHFETGLYTSVRCGLCRLTKFVIYREAEEREESTTTPHAREDTLHRTAVW